MPTTTLTTGQEAIWLIGAAGADGSPKPATFTATVSDHANAYVTLRGSNELHFVPVNPGSYTVTVTGNSADGTALPADVQSFIVTAPPVPQATNFTDSPVTVANTTITTPADPGVDHVSGSL